MKYFLSLFLLFLSVFLSAQDNYWQGGLFLGASAFSGDVNPQSTPDISEISLAAGFMGRVDVSNKIGFRGGIVYAKLKGDDANYPIRAGRGFRFNTTLIELSGVAEWEPFASNRYYSTAKGGVEMDRIVSPYLFGGLGLGFATLDTDYSRYGGNNPLIEQGIRDDRSKGSAQTVLVFPVGAGIKFDITNRFTLGLEFGARISFNDMMDGISASANPENNDVYIFSGLTTYYRFFN